MNHAYSFLYHAQFLVVQGATDDAKITIQVDRHNNVELRDSQYLKLRLRGATHSGKIVESNFTFKSLLGLGRHSIDLADACKFIFVCLTVDMASCRHIETNFYIFHPPRMHEQLRWWPS